MTKIWVESRVEGQGWRVALANRWDKADIKGRVQANGSVSPSGTPTSKTLISIASVS